MLLWMFSGLKNDSMVQESDIYHGSKIKNDICKNKFLITSSPAWQLATKEFYLSGPFAHNWQVPEVFNLISESSICWPTW